ncbi:MAG: hypothetical protein QOI71_153, partial [Gaiellales bacterium]|nr:hypothetical protein [Gaiellales bacterium]
MNALELLDVDSVLGPFREPLERRQQRKSGNRDLDGASRTGSGSALIERPPAGSLEPHGDARQR